MKLEDSSLYTSSDVYLNGPDGMDNEVAMWAVGSGLLMREIVRKIKGHPYGGLHGEIGIELRRCFPQTSVLDVCCGPGNFSNYLSLYYPRLEVTGIDINETFIRAAQDRFKKYGWQFLKADARKFKLGRKFDFVLASSAYHHIEDKDKVDFLTQIRNHLARKGKVIVCENILPRYKSKQERNSAVHQYYGTLKQYYDRGNATPKARQAIEEVYSLELSDVEEHKVDFQRFRKHIKSSNLEIELDIPIWQPTSFRKDNAGSHVFILRHDRYLYR